MPALLLVPLIVAGVILLAVLLLPLTLVQRLRFGVRRQKALGWMVRANTWLLGLSQVSFLLGAWMATRWVPEALHDAALGDAAGLLLGALGLALTRFERRPEGLWFTPNRWMVLLLVSIVAARIGWGFWNVFGAGPLAEVGVRTRHAWGGLLAVGGLLLGHASATTLGMRMQLPPPVPTRLGRLLRGPAPPSRDAATRATGRRGGSTPRA